MPGPIDLSKLTAMSQGLLDAEPITRPTRTLHNLSNSAMGAVDSLRNMFKQQPAKPTGDINLPNATGEIDPRLKQLRYGGW